MEPLLCVHGRFKKKWRDVADVACVFNISLRDLSYEAFVGLWLNLPRAHAQIANDVANGCSMAAGAEVPRSVMEAISYLGDGKEKWNQQQTSNAMSRVLKRYGFE